MDLHEEAERLAELPALRFWQEKARQSGPFQVPEYEDFAAIVQEHEALAARLAEVEDERDEWKRQAIHHNTEHGKRVEELREKGLEVLSHLGQAHDAWEAQKKAERERDEARARVAAVAEEAAALVKEDWTLNEPPLFKDGARWQGRHSAPVIRALARPEETDALDRIKAENTSLKTAIATHGAEACGILKSYHQEDGTRLWLALRAALDQDNPKTP